MTKIPFFFTCLIMLCEVGTVAAKTSLFQVEPAEDPVLALFSDPVPETQRTATSRLNKTELRSAAFYPSSDRFRKVYGNVGLSLQAEGARTLKNHQHFEIWENIEWIFMHGKGHPHSCGKTRIDILNISLGLKTIGTVVSNWLYLYAGIGPDLGIVFIEDEMHCSNSKIKEHNTYIGFGGILKTGAQAFLSPTVYISAFADYLYLPVSMHNTVDVGGLKVGGGLGARF